MELYDIYRWVFWGGLIACGIFFAISVVLFFTLRIPKVISDLTGRTARKAIENIRLQNEQSGDKSYQSSAVNLERGKLTDKISRSGRLVPREATPFGTGVITEKISTQKLDAADGGPETTVLSAADETSVLSTGMGETTQLYQDDPYDDMPILPIFQIEFEITYIHTDKVIV